ncbi:MAG: cell division protein ZapA [Bacteroidaceae bacterium]|nr:cell division protein ZapA [Bacteroidaceae bacterium]
MEKGRQNITITVEGIPLPMTVADATEEEVFRKAATEVQSRLRFLRTTYPGLPSNTYYYSMAMLLTAVDKIKMSMNVDNSPIFDTLNDLQNEIDGAIASSRKKK